MAKFCLDFYNFEESSDLETLPLLDIQWPLILQFCFLDDWLKLFFTRCIYFYHNWWKEGGTKINSSNKLNSKINSWRILPRKKCGTSKTQLTLDNLNIQKIEPLKTKLSHKLPSEKNLQKITFDNSNSHCLEQICVSL